ncbi:uncharacterized protein LOC110943461 [Helianthus annuus]|uniref:uncharacterized protein LOC110943461 n=1 Tax=Helianthus annuus TaxID=4232 RepID=UPI000B8FA3EA|nr:uncharacterized protein LOC110943461 [Helianthus annuus]
MSELQLTGGLKKLNEKNYNTWATCMSSYLQGQDLWDIVDGTDVEPPRENEQGALRKWRIKAGKALFALKTTVEEEVLDHIREVKSPKEAWDELKILFSRKNDTRLQLLENELLSVSQKDLTIPQYFHRVKTLCREIGELDPENKIGEFHSFLAAVQGWPTQPSLGEFENLLASQENLAKQMGDMSISTTPKPEAEALYAERTKGKERYKGRGHYKANRPNNNYKGEVHNNHKSEAQSRRGHESDKGESSDRKPRNFGK